MKKILAVTAIMLLVCTCVFASHRVSVSLDPFTFQHFVQKDGDAKSYVNSTYGLGGGIGYDYSCCENFRVGAEVKADTYFIEEQKNYTDISFFATAGYDFSFTDEIALYANLKAGLDLQMHNEKTSAVLEFGPEVGAGYRINEKLNVFAGCEMLFGFPKKGEVHYREMRVTPVLGVGYTF